MKGPGRSRKRWDMWGPAYNGRLPKFAIVLREFGPSGLPFLGLAPEHPARRIGLNEVRVREMELARDVAVLADTGRTGKLTPRSAAHRLADKTIADWRERDPVWWRLKGRIHIGPMHDALSDAIYRAWRKHRDDLATIFASEPD
jgi:hypothetical protein